MKKNPSKPGLKKEDKKEAKTEEKKASDEDQEQQEEKKEAVLELTGYDRFEYSNGIVYTGNWKLTNGAKVKEGHGKLSHIFPNSKVPLTEEYEGEWSNDMMNGYGVYKYASGATYSGNWKNNRHHGYGVYVMANGCKFEGEWEDHRFHGPGTFTDLERIPWKGEYVHGTYDSKNQKKLQAERATKNQIEEVKKSARTLFSSFIDTFTQCDKKNHKEALGPFFATNDTLAEFVNEPYPKMDEKPFDKWAAAMTMLRDSQQTNIHVLKHPSNATFMEPSKIRAEQLSKDGGQVVEFSLTVAEDQFVKLAAAQTKEKKWVICFYQDNIPTLTTGKKK